MTSNKNKLAWCVAWLLFFVGGQAQAARRATMSVGPASAPVTIEVFSDYECPFSVRVEKKVLPQIRRIYGHRVRFVYKNFPLKFHKNAHLAAQAVRAAHAQGKFLPYHQALLNNYRKLNRKKIMDIATSLRLTIVDFWGEIEHRYYKPGVDADIAEGKRRGVRGTPTFFINGTRLIGAQSLSAFRRIIDKKLNGRTGAGAVQVLRRSTPSRLRRSTPSRLRRSTPSRLRPVVPSKPRARVQAKQIQRIKVPVAQAPQDGPADALVTIVKFGDFQCPFCARGARTLKQIKQRYGPLVRIVYRHQPLAFHKQAHLAAQAAMAAHDQGRFWEYHDLLYANRRKLKQPQLLRYAKQLGLDLNAFSQALRRGQFRSYIEADRKIARRVGALGTPTFFINGRRLVGARAFSIFKKIIDDEIQRGRSLMRRFGIPSRALYGYYMRSAKTRYRKARFKRSSRARRARKKVYTKVPVGNAPALGPNTALVTIVEFSDFQCPFCTRAATTMQQIKKAYGNKVRIVFRHYPLPFHRQAKLAARASMAAHAQGRFWAYHDLLFKNYRQLNRTNMIRWALELGLDVVKFRSDLANPQSLNLVEADMALGRRVGVRGTPNFFVNGKRVSGAQPFARFKKVIDVEMARAKALLRSGVPPQRLYDEVMRQILPNGRLKKTALGNKLRPLNARGRTAPRPSPATPTLPAPTPFVLPR